MASIHAHMKKILTVLMALSIIAACNDNKSTKEKYHREKTTREQDDYSKSKNTTTTESNEQKTPPAVEPEEKKEEPQMEPSATDAGHRGWSSTDRESFLQTCVGTASNKAGPERAREYCDCMLKKLERKYATYADANTDLALPGNDAFLQKMIDDCNGKK